MDAPRPISSSALPRPTSSACRSASSSTRALRTFAWVQAVSGTIVAPTHWLERGRVQATSHVPEIKSLLSELHTTEAELSASQAELTTAGPAHVRFAELEVRNTALETRVNNLQLQLDTVTQALTQRTATTPAVTGHPNQATIASFSSSSPPHRVIRGRRAIRCM